MTQTTAVRVESILESHLHLIPLMVGVDGESADIGGMTEAAQKIAAEIDALTRERDEARAEVERLRPAAEAWRQVFELQAKYSTHWRLNDETYWLARFMEEVGELAGALVGNHVGPVEWELSQLAAIALNWLDMRAARARAAKEAKP